MLVGQGAQSLEVGVGERRDPALALHRLDKDRGGLLIDRRLDKFQIARLDMLVAGHGAKASA